jgi:RimJ/RimL family protein N-acetyltransferase
MGEVSPKIEIETPRLFLRRLRGEDFESLFRMVADSEMWRFPEREPMTSEEAWSLILRHEGGWQVIGHGVFAVQEKVGGGFVGLTGFSDFRRCIGPDFDPYPEITWSIIPAAQLRGYATEAGDAAIRWLSRQASYVQSVCLIHRENRASLAVARKLGYERFRTLEYKGNPTILMRRPG